MGWGTYQTVAAVAVLALGLLALLGCGSEISSGTEEDAARAARADAAARAAKAARKRRAERAGRVWRRWLSRTRAQTQVRAAAPAPRTQPRTQPPSRRESHGARVPLARTVPLLETRTVGRVPAPEASRSGTAAPGTGGPRTEARAPAPGGAAAPSGPTCFDSGCEFVVSEFAVSEPTGIALDDRRGPRTLWITRITADSVSLGTTSRGKSLRASARPGGSRTLHGLTVRVKAIEDGTAVLAVSAAR